MKVVTQEKNMCPISYFALNTPDAIALTFSHKSFTYKQINEWINRSIREFASKNETKYCDHLTLMSSVNLIHQFIIVFMALRLGKTLAIIDPFFSESQPTNTLFIDKSPNKMNCFKIPEYKSSDDTRPELAFIKTDAYIELFTSGTTHQPKRVIHTFNSIMTSARSLAEYFKLQKDDSWLVNLPMHHISGLAPLFRMIHVGGTIIFSDTKKFIMSDCLTYNVTHLSCVVTTLERLIKTSFCKSQHTLKAILLGGSAIPDKLFHQDILDTLPIFVSYGMTETASAVAISTWKSFKKDKKLTLLPHVSARVNNNYELLLKGDSLLKEYDMNKTPIDKKGFFKTGDIVELNQGSIKIKGRIDAMFISGGENIYPKMIEDVFLKHTQLKKVRVTIEEDKVFQYVSVLHYKGIIDLETLKHIAKTYLPPHARPKKYILEK